MYRFPWWLHYPSGPNGDKLVISGESKGLGTWIVKRVHLVVKRINYNSATVGELKDESIESNITIFPLNQQAKVWVPSADSKGNYWKTHVLKRRFIVGLLWSRFLWVSSSSASLGLASPDNTPQISRWVQGFVFVLRVDWVCMSLAGGVWMDPEFPLTNCFLT